MCLSIFFELARTNVPSQADGGPRDRFYPCSELYYIEDAIFVCIHPLMGVGLNIDLTKPNLT